MVAGYLGHRGGLPGRLLPEASLLARFGGPDSVARFVDALYDRVAEDPELAPVFAHHAQQGRGRVTQFFVEWMGGPKTYSAEFAFGQQRAHFKAMVTRRGAGRWLTHVGDALSECAILDDVADEVMGLLGPMARGLVNETRPDAELLSSCHKLNGLRAFWRMAEKGDLAGLKSSLAEQLELVHVRGEDGKTLLWEAARGGHAAVVEYLIDAGADVNAPGLKRPAYALTSAVETLVMTTPYCVAKLRKRTRVAAMLLDAGAVVDVFTCALLGDLARVEELVSVAPELAGAWDPAEDVFPVTPLHHAVCGQHGDVVEFLLGQGVEVAGHSMGLLTLAVRRNAMGLARRLIEHGARGDDCGKLLGDVGHAGRLDWAELLVGCGATADGVVVDGRTLVEFPDVGRLLLSHGGQAGALVRLCNGNQGNLGDHPDYVRAVLAAGADVHETDRLGRTALHTSVKSGFLEYVPILLEYGADLERFDGRGHTPVELALAGKSPDAAIPLLEAGAVLKPVTYGKTEETPLHRAARTGSVALVRALLDAGADVRTRTTLGESALELAEDGGHPEVVGLLRGVE